MVTFVKIYAIVRQEIFMKNKFTKDYNPLYFLSSLGNGGLAVSFFMYLMFMIKHPDSPIPTFNHISKIITADNKVAALLVILSLVFILFFAARHYLLLVQNLRAYQSFKKTDEFHVLKTSNAEITLMAIPLTYGMSINVAFILGALFVPGLWNVVEYLFPVAILALGVTGIYGMKLMSEYFSRLIIKGDFDFINNNNLSQLLSSFAFAMISVGLAAPAAMSHIKAVSVIGTVASIFFATISIMLLTIKLILGFKSIFRQGIASENTPSLWIVIPIMTLFGITFVRLVSGIYENLLEAKPSPVLFFVAIAFLMSVQGIIGLIGYAVMKQTNYFKEYISGEKSSVGSYSLICPGVATFVLGMFFIHKGMVKAEILEQFSIAYFLILVPFIFIQLKTITTLFRIDKKLICKGNCNEINGHPKQYINA